VSAVSDVGLVLLFFAIVLPFYIGRETDCEDFANGGSSWYLPGKAERFVSAVLDAEPIAMRDNGKISG
jgi:hypothetical protein